MKILFYRYGSICEPDLVETFEELGFQVTQMTHEVHNKNLLFQDSLKLVSDFLLDHPHDCVFTINFFPHISEVCNIFHIRYICWIVDSPVMELFTKPIQNPWNRIFLFDRDQYREIEPLNPGHVFHFPLGVNIRQKQAVIQKASPSLRAHFRADLSFIGSLYTEKSPYDKLQDPPDYLVGYLKGIMEAQLQVYGAYFIDDLLTDDLVKQFKDHLPGFYQYPLENFLTDKMIMSQLYIGNKITALERYRTIKRLSENFSMDLYTNSDTSPLPQVHNRGTAKTLEEMPVIFHESKINLNTTSKAIRSAAPLRVFDILGCEGFMLSNYQTEVCELFEAGRDFDYYASMDELEEKTAYYLGHESLRREIAHNGFETAARLYNYPVRLAALMELAYS